MKWCELREYKWNEYVTIAVNYNLSNCEKARKKDFGASTGFKPVASALALQCSTSLSYEDPYTGGWPIYLVHQPVKGVKHRMKWCELQEYKWNEYVTIAVNRNLSNCEKARKKGFWGFNGIRTRGLCISAAVLYQLELCGWNSLYWISFFGIYLFILIIQNDTKVHLVYKNYILKNLSIQKKLN